MPRRFGAREAGEGYTSAPPCGHGRAGAGLLRRPVVAVGGDGEGAGHGAVGVGGGRPPVLGVDAEVQVEGGPLGRPHRRHHRRSHACAPGTLLLP
jgi:hypothetical protein